MPQGTETVAEHRSGMDRRTLIKAAGAAGVAAWSAPVIYGSLASPAAAQQSSCTAITRVGTGTIAAAENNTGSTTFQITPTLPGGSQVEDTILLICLCRPTSASTVTVNNGYAARHGCERVQRRRRR